jgi:uncharacterized membrane protein
MILASTDSTGYKIVLILHILFVVAAFGGMFAAPILARVEGASQSAATGMVGYLKRIAIPSVIIAGILGMGLIGMSKDGDVEVYKFSQTWVSIALLLWLVEIAVYFFGLLPAERKVAGGDAEAAKRLPMFTGIVHLLLLVLIYLMVFKPGT